MRSNPKLSFAVGNILAMCLSKIECPIPYLLSSSNLSLQNTRSCNHTSLDIRRRLFFLNLEMSNSPLTYLLVITLVQSLFFFHNHPPPYFGHESKVHFMHFFNTQTPHLLSGVLASPNSLMDLSLSICALPQELLYHFIYLLQRAFGTIADCFLYIETVIYKLFQ